MNPDAKAILPDLRRVKKNPLSIQFMKPKLNRFQARLVCAVALGMGSSFSLAAAAADSADTAETSIPWSQLGAKAGADYQGDGLAVIPTADGARLRCVFQRLEGEATREGLWLASTAAETNREEFRVVAAAVGRAGEAFGVPASAGFSRRGFRIIPTLRIDRGATG